MVLRRLRLDEPAHDLALLVDRLFSFWSSIAQLRIQRHSNSRRTLLCNAGNGACSARNHLKSSAYRSYVLSSLFELLMHDYLGVGETAISSYCPSYCRIGMAQQALFDWKSR
jgi:hypothetical protein